MNNVLILYPDKFKCTSKFNRKISLILQNIKTFTLHSKHDNNELIINYINNNNTKIKYIKNENLDIGIITHAIIFDDGEEFTEEHKLIESLKIPVRIIKIKITRVVNIKDEPQYKNLKSSSTYEYIGRGSYWGNPYSMYEQGDDREEVIRKYKYDFDFDLFPKKEKSKIYELAGKRLGCFCKPSSCHGDILADFLNSWDDDK